MCEPAASILAEPLTADAFQSFGDVLEARDEPDLVINDGFCGRWHDLAKLDIVDGHAGVSLFKARARRLPHRLDLMERHPFGSQAFLPMTENPFLVIVAPDEDGIPGLPRAFVTASGQGVNYYRGTWHGVLTPIADPGLFAVVDRIGNGPNLEVHRLKQPLYIEIADILIDGSRQGAGDRPGEV